MRDRLLSLIASGDLKTFLIEFYHAVGSDPLGTFTDYRVFESIGYVRGNDELVADGLILSLVYRDGGGEGEGEYVERVYRIDDGETPVAHLQITGRYDSHEGTEWYHEVNRVYPKEVVVTQYVTEL